MNTNNSDEVMHNASQTITDLADAGKDYATQAMDKANAAKNRANASMRRMADATTEYVAEQPVRSVCIAAGVGAAVTLLAYGMYSRKSRC
jgi:ElaB/YqjD/DUF883 family membrane-anchored ribosome-binding protein